MASAATTTVTATPMLRPWERALLAVPAVVGLVLGCALLVLPARLATAAGFAADDPYISRLAGGAFLGYGVALALGLAQPAWRAVRLPVAGALVCALGTLYAGVAQLVVGPAPAAVGLALLVALLVVACTGTLLARHRGAPAPAPDLDRRPLRAVLGVGAVAAGFFGLVPLLAPGVFTAVHLHLTAPFLIRLAGASSLGYAVVAVLAQRALSRLEMRLTLVGTAIFNGLGGLVSLPLLRGGDVLLLPWVIAPVGLLVCAGCVYLLRRAYAAPAEVPLTTGLAA